MYPASPTKVHCKRGAQRRTDEMENDTWKAISTRIADIRRSHKVTQEALAEMLDVSPKHISHVENATSNLSLKNLIQFCTIFDCSFDYVIFGKQNNEALSKLPDEIVQILYTGTSRELDCLRRYLQIYIELKNNP